MNLQYKITTILCTYNGAAYIEQQIQSIIKQSQEVDEIIICDDGSTDKTLEIIATFMKYKPTKIQLYVNKETLRVNKNFEKALRLSTGDYIFFSDQDDVWETDKVAQIMSIFKKNPTANGVFSNANLIDAQGKKIGFENLWNNVLFAETAISGPEELYTYCSTIRNMVTGATLCISAETKKFILPFPDVSIMYHDEWIALNLASKCSLFYTINNCIIFSQYFGINYANLLR